MTKTRESIQAEIDSHKAQLAALESELSAIQPAAPLEQPDAEPVGVVEEITEKFYQIIESLNDGQLTRTIAEREFSEALTKLVELPEPSERAKGIAADMLAEMLSDYTLKECKEVAAALIAATEGENHG